MVEPEVFVNEGRADLLSILPFWSKYSVDPPFLWESWIGKFFMAVGLKDTLSQTMCWLTRRWSATRLSQKRRHQQPQKTQWPVLTFSATSAAAVRRNDEGNAEHRQKRPLHCPELALPWASCSPQIKAVFFHRKWKKSDVLQTPIYTLNLMCALSKTSTMRVKQCSKLLAIIR